MRNRIIPFPHPIGAAARKSAAVPAPRQQSAEDALYESAWGESEERIALRGAPRVEDTMSADEASLYASAWGNQRTAS